MKKVLIAYSTNAGSTEEVARAIADVYTKCGHQADVMRLDAVTDINHYDALIIGAPMILGWQRSAQQFLKRHQRDLAQIPVAYFCTLMSLTQTGETQVGGIPIAVDPWLAKAPKNAQRLSFRENYATASNYLRPIVQAATQVRPVSVAFFGGKLELFRLKWWQMLFVMVIIQAQPADLRNWDYIERWAAETQLTLLGEPVPAVVEV